MTIKLCTIQQAPFWKRCGLQWSLTWTLPGTFSPPLTLLSCWERMLLTAKSRCQVGLGRAYSKSFNETMSLFLHFMQHPLQLEDAFWLSPLLSFLALFFLALIVLILLCSITIAHFCWYFTQLKAVHEQLTAFSEVPVIKTKKRKEKDKKEDSRQNKGSTNSCSR